MSVNQPVVVARRLASAGACSLLVSAGYLAPTLDAPSVLGIIIATMLGFCAATGVFFWRSPFSRTALSIVPAFTAALLVAMSIPIAKDGYPDVSITATGQKNPNSKSSEVFVRLMPAPNFGLHEFEGEGWEKRGDVFVSYKEQPNILHYRGAWNSYSALRIVRHPYSGIAEISIGGRMQRLDLFSEKESYVDVQLPEATVSWKGHIQRAMIIVGLGAFFTVGGIGVASVSAIWGCVFSLALLAGCGTLWMVHDRSYAGSLEVVAFAANSELVRVEMDAGHGFTPALVVPVKGGRSVQTEFALPNPVDWKLGIEGASLRAFRNPASDVAVEASSSDDNGCAIIGTGSCVYEVEGAAPHSIWLQSDDGRKSLTLPITAAGSERLFLLVEREPGRIAVSASRAYLQLPPWEHFSRWVVAVRLVGRDGKAADNLVRLSSDDRSSSILVQADGVNGSYNVPNLERSDTRSFAGMKIFASLISVSFVLLLAAAGMIANALARCYREGRRFEVIGAIFGCLLWLGLSIAIGWPAVIGWDGFSPYMHAQTGQIGLWYGIGYPLIIGGFLTLGSGPLITAWSALGTACLLLGVSAFLLRRGSVAAGWLAPALLCAVLPFTAISIGTLTHLRDTMNGLMLVMFAFGGFYAALKWKEWSCVPRNWAFVVLLLGGAVLALMRIDNLPTLIVLAAGLALGVHGFTARSLSLVVVAAVCWIGVGSQLEGLLVLDKQGAADEKRLYNSTAVINPLVGMLVQGKGRIPDELYFEISGTLDKVLDVEYAVQSWSPYHIVYWHETYAKRGIPNVETNEQLRNLYVRSLSADPVLFMQLRLATFGAILGHNYFELETYKEANYNGHPSFHDHLLSADEKSKHLSELFGYPPAAHSHPNLTRSMLNWQSTVASTVPQLLVCIVIALGFRRRPLAAVLAFGALVHAGVFFLLAPASVFFYLYDMHLLGFLLPMMALTEQGVRINCLASKDIL